MIVVLRSEIHELFACLLISLAKGNTSCNANAELGPCVMSMILFASEIYDLASSSFSRYQDNFAIFSNAIPRNGWRSDRYILKLKLI